MKLLHLVIGWFLASFGFVIALFAMLGMIDPTGTQMANDADPFGQTPSKDEMFFRLALALGAIVIGLWLVIRGGKK